MLKYTASCVGIYDGTIQRFPVHYGSIHVLYTILVGDIAFVLTTVYILNVYYITGQSSTYSSICTTES